MRRVVWVLLLARALIGDRGELLSHGTPTVLRRQLRRQDLQTPADPKKFPTVLHQRLRDHGSAVPNDADEAF